jgi:hypothetical protein
MGQVQQPVGFETFSKFQTKLLNYDITLMTIGYWHKILNGLLLSSAEVKYTNKKHKNSTGF